MNDVIEIRKLRITTNIGVPDEERATAQELLLTVVMTPETRFEDLNDDIANTVDYHAVSVELAILAEEKPRRLIETLAADVADHILSRHPVRKVRVRVEKFILPQTDHVAVEVVRETAQGVIKLPS